MCRSFHIDTPAPDASFDSMTILRRFEFGSFGRRGAVSPDHALYCYIYLGIYLHYQISAKVHAAEARYPVIYTINGEVCVAVFPPLLPCMCGCPGVPGCSQVPDSRAVMVRAGQEPRKGHKDPS